MRGIFGKVRDAIGPAPIFVSALKYSVFNISMEAST